MNRTTTKKTSSRPSVRKSAVVKSTAKKSNPAKSRPGAKKPAVKSASRIELAKEKHNAKYLKMIDESIRQAEDCGLSMKSFGKRGKN